MTDKFMKMTDYSVLFLLAFIILVPLLAPVFASPDLAILYKSLIAFAGFIFVMSGKLQKEEQKIETPVDGSLLALLALLILSVFFSKNTVSTFNAAVT
ncbi:MAG: hypothetical protein LLG37_02160, partial [Spirochaetia bacterium]|nr:hypothetical protein [Spirochaetia bacterium]